MPLPPLPALNAPARLIAGAIVGALLVAGAASCVQTVGVNEVGLKFNKAGSDRGLKNLTVVSGYVLINPLLQQVVTYPRKQVNYTWTGDESFTLSTSDQMSLGADVSVGIQVIPERAPDIYIRFGPAVEPILHGYIHTLVRDTITRSSSKFSTDQILGAGRADFEDVVEKSVSETLRRDGFVLTNLGLVGAIRPPANITEAINQKFTAQQNAISAQNKIVQSRAEAQQQIAAAQGRAQAILVEARAQAQANAALAKSLTPELVRIKEIEKWDGRVSMVSGASGTLLQLPQTAATPQPATGTP